MEFAHSLRSLTLDSFLMTHAHTDHYHAHFEPCSSVGTVNRLRTGRSGVRIPAAAGKFSLIRNVETESGAHPVVENHTFPRKYISPPLPISLSLSLSFTHTHTHTQHTEP